MLEKTKLNNIVLISNALMDSYISQNEFVSVCNIIKKYDDLKEEIKNFKMHQLMNTLIYLKHFISKIVKAKNRKVILI